MLEGSVCIAPHNQLRADQSQPRKRIGIRYRIKQKALPRIWRDPANCIEPPDINDEIAENRIAFYHSPVL